MVLRRKLPSQLEEKVKSAEVEAPKTAPEETAEAAPTNKMQKRTPKEEKTAEPEKKIEEPPVEKQEEKELPAPEPMPVPPEPATTEPETPAHQPPEFLGGGSVDDVLNQPEKEDSAPEKPMAPKAEAPVVTEEPATPVPEEVTPPKEEPKPEPIVETPEPKPEPELMPTPEPVEEAPSPTPEPKPRPAPEAQLEPPAAAPAAAPVEKTKPATAVPKKSAISFDEESSEDSVLPWVAAPNKIEDWDTPATETPKEPEQPAAAGTPPWVQNAGKNPPPTLPGDNEGLDFNGAPIASDQYNTLRNGALLILVVGILFGVYILFFRQQENTTEMLARWTGTLSEVSQEVPTEIQEEQPLAATEEFLPDPTTENDNAPIQPLPLEELPDVEETTIVLAEPKPEPNPTKKEPSAEDVSLFASLQSAIKEAKKEKEQAEDSATPEAKEEDKLVQGQAAEVDLEAELAAYRQQLANSTGNEVLPKPGTFFEKYKGQDAPAMPLPTLPPVDQGTVASAPLNAPAPYNPNPAGLPIVGEPKMPERPAVRQLEHFDATMFAAAEPSVRIPKNLRPSMNANAFPELEILSLVPNRGVIALKDDREGVLMIGETIEGWELISVYDEYAEFQKNNRRHIMTRN